VSKFDQKDIDTFVQALPLQSLAKQSCARRVHHTTAWHEQKRPVQIHPRVWQFSLQIHART